MAHSRGIPRIALTCLLSHPVEGCGNLVIWPASGHSLHDLYRVIFCFPQWWFGMLAVLKGYFDRVWVPGVAFEHDLARGRLKPLLTGIKIFGIVTSYGSPWWIARIVAGDPGRKVLLRALKPLCSGANSFYLAHYAMDRSTATTRAAFLEKVRRRIARL